MTRTIQQPKFEIFDKYEFVKSYVSITHPKNEEAKKEREEEAALIANAIKDTQNVLLENLATKDDIESLKLASKTDLKELEYKLMIKGGVFLTLLITFAPKLWKFLEIGGL